MISKHSESLRAYASSIWSLLRNPEDKAGNVVSWDTTGDLWIEHVAAGTDKLYELYLNAVSRSLPYRVYFPHDNPGYRHRDELYEFARDNCSGLIAYGYANSQFFIACHNEIDAFQIKLRFY